MHATTPVVANQITYMKNYFIKAKGVETAVRIRKLLFKLQYQYTDYQSIIVLLVDQTYLYDCQQFT